MQRASPAPTGYVQPPPQYAPPPPSAPVEPVPQAYNQVPPQPQYAPPPPPQAQPLPELPPPAGGYVTGAKSA
ncbi:hypothetical protein QR680_004412 [Steinernema hermaphroditum]|uniref:Uncharacterized protein n=1 Tax=Steinernema hermaphroditum TaxID=289476 RepID=A0AA39LTY2_9BILA|nr:hypothetical protein QR680_004412 [Steinernema hermaphroditum]